MPVNCVEWEASEWRGVRKAGGVKSGYTQARWPLNTRVQPWGSRVSFMERFRGFVVVLAVHRGGVGSNVGNSTMAFSHPSDQSHRTLDSNTGPMHTACRAGFWSNNVTRPGADDIVLRWHKEGWTRHTDMRPYVR